MPDGVSVADLRDSERDLLEENRVNFMTAEYKHEYMKNGICGDGNFIDNVLGADYITHQIRENLYEIFIAGLWNCTLSQLTRRMTPVCTRL